MKNFSGKIILKSLCILAFMLFSVPAFCEETAGEDNSFKTNEAEMQREDYSFSSDENSIVVTEENNNEEVFKDIDVNYNEGDGIELEKEEKVELKIAEPIEMPMAKEKQSFLNLFGEDGYQFDEGIIKSQRFTYFMHGANVMKAESGKDFSDTFEYAANEFQSSTVFRDGNTRFDWGVNFTRTRKYNHSLLAKVSFAELWHIFNENQQIVVGNCRVQNGFEGGIPSSQLKFVTRSQIARTFGNAVSDNIRNRGKYKYFEYDLGISDGSRWWQNVFNGFDTTLIASAKPLAKFDNKYGKLKIGGSIDQGRAEKTTWTVVGGHALYDYKNKAGIDFEYQYADGYAGSWYSKDKAHGLYTTVYYYLTPKVQLLARYDYFKNIDRDKHNTEYTAGINYWLTPKSKLMLNYILAKSNTSNHPTHKIYIGADFTTYSLVDLICERL